LGDKTYNTEDLDCHGKPYDDAVALEDKVEDLRGSLEHMILLDDCWGWDDYSYMVRSPGVELYVGSEVSSKYIMGFINKTAKEVV